MNFEPLQITAHMATPCVGHHFLPIDSILLYQVMVQRDDFSVLHTPGVMIPYEPDDLPLEIIRAGDEWYYAASFAVWGNFVEGQSMWNKRLDTVYSRFTSGRANTGEGRYKNYHSPLYYRFAPTITWYVRGNAARISKLLRLCSGIGKKRAYGWGAVLDWDVRPGPDMCLYDADESPMRAIPVTDISKLPDRVQHYGIRPPYWHRSNQRLCLMPTHAG